MGNFLSKIKDLFRRRRLLEPIQEQGETPSVFPEADCFVRVSQESEDEEEYEVVELEILPAKIICPDCGGITLEGLDFCDKCGGELQ